MIKVETYENDVLVYSKELKPEIIEDDKNGVEEQREKDQDGTEVRKPPKAKRGKS